MEGGGGAPHRRPKEQGKKLGARRIDCNRVRVINTYDPVATQSPVIAYRCGQSRRRQFKHFCSRAVIDKKKDWYKNTAGVATESFCCVPAETGARTATFWFTSVLDGTQKAQESPQALHPVRRAKCPRPCTHTHTHTHCLTHTHTLSHTHTHVSL